MRRRGMVLVAVMVIMALAAMVAASAMFRLRAETTAAVARNHGEQARAAAMSGIRHAMAVLKDPEASPALWGDNPELFQNQLVAEAANVRWFFTIYADNPEDPESVRYGLIDEGGKINLNLAREQTLLNLPNMTAERVDSLLDWRDADDETRPSGAEQDWYDQLDTPYAVKNGFLSTLDELLLIKGFDGSVVWGEDANLNGMLEATEDDGDETFPPDDGDGQLDTGLRALATVWSYGPNVNRDGEPRVHINSPDVEKADLPKQTIEFISAYLADGNTFEHPAELLNMKYTPKKPPAEEAPRRRGRRGRRRRREPEPVELASGVGADELPLVLDALTARPGRMVFGRVNVNTAPQAALAAMEGIDENLAGRIVDARRRLSAETQATIAWLYTQDVMDEQTFKALAPRLTARSWQYRVRCVGFSPETGRYRVFEAVLDFARGDGRIAYMREITRLGLPMPLDVDTQVSR